MRAIASFMVLAGNTDGLTAKAYVATAILLTGARSVEGLYGRSLNRAGVIVNVFTVTIRVWPSGLALATKSVPMLPLAPGLFSTTTGCFHRSESLGPITRARMSMPVPVVNGTTRVTGRLGKPCACASAENRRRTAATNDL